MIKSKKELKFCISADYMMNRGYFKEPISKKTRISYISRLDYEILGSITQSRVLF